MTHGDLKFQGDRVEVDLTTKIVTARGNVVLDQGPKRITAETLVFDMDSETGKFSEAKAYVDPDIYFNGAEIEKVGDDIYVLRDGVVTSCSGDVPVWSFKAGKIRINADGYTKIKHTSMRFKKLPMLYLPYMMYPSNQERKSGFLFPNIGYSDRRGYLLGLAYYQTLGESYDATLLADVYGEDFFGLGAEFRYQPTNGTGGQFEGYAIDDPVLDERRWKATLTHTTTDLPKGLRGVVRIIQISDFNFFRDFERNFSQISQRRLNSAAYLTGNWGSHSFNFVLDELETLIRSNVTQTQRQLPEVEYFLRPTKLFGLPVYLDLASSAHYFQAERTGFEKVTYGRADLAPQLTVPLSYWPWLSAKVSAGGRATYYEDSLNTAGNALSGESLTRTYPFGDLSIIGPSFSRIFDKKIGVFGKFKHIIEPRISYEFVGEPSNQNQVPIFDSIDNVRKQSIVTYALVNRLLAKPADEESGLGAREIMSFELSQQISLNDDQPFQLSSDGTQSSQHSRIGMRFRFSPAAAHQLRGARDLQHALQRGGHRIDLGQHDLQSALGGADLVRAQERGAGHHHQPPGSAVHPVRARAEPAALRLAGQLRLRHPHSAVAPTPAPVLRPVLLAAVRVPAVDDAELRRPRDPARHLAQEHRHLPRPQRRRPRGELLAGEKGQASLRILITGVSGFIGRRVVDALAARGHELAGTYVERRPPQLGLELFRAELSDQAALAEACDGFRPDRILHLAGLSQVGASFEQREAYHQVNAVGTGNLVRAASPAPVVSGLDLPGVRTGARGRAADPRGA